MSSELLLRKKQRLASIRLGDDECVKNVKNESYVMLRGDVYVVRWLLQQLLFTCMNLRLNKNGISLSPEIFYLKNGTI